ncbi:MAG: UDP-N-acetylmuramate dehydrogenase [Proteobacteria bacterium]|nr:UDP-N-acetylmuramate dehydrogenase [Pseudomonadota bacterium]MCZ6781792.1 UDP-N-acetylmuramate dehydrogenase [Pseudomonadota bacterium]
MRREARAALEEVLGDRVAFDVPMSRYTSMRVGGPADVVATPADRHELGALLRACAKHGLPHCVLGAGFNTLVLDGGLPGVAIHTRGLRRLEERPDRALRAEAGVSHGSVTRFCTTRGLSGLEFAAGIPGTVGGWVAMNAGIGTREVVDVVREVEVMSPTGRRRRHLAGGRLCFGYRGLRGLAPGSVIVSVLLAVSLAEPAQVKAEVDRLLEARAGSQPLNVPSCGSVFRNPPGDYAGRLIEAAGMKGAVEGGAQISTVHANFIATQPGARAADVLALIRRAQREVELSSGIRLVPEVKIVGRES